MSTFSVQVTPGISQASLDDLLDIRNSSAESASLAEQEKNQAQLAAQEAKQHSEQAALSTRQAKQFKDGSLLSAQEAEQYKEEAVLAAQQAEQHSGQAALSTGQAKQYKEEAKQVKDAAVEMANTAEKAANLATIKAEEVSEFAYAAAIQPHPGQVPLADENGKISIDWLGKDVAAKLRQDDIQLNNIGEPGKLGFGVGIAPSYMEGYSSLPGTHIKGHPEYGNYRYADGSVMVWIPAFYYRIGHPDNPTYDRMLNVQGYNWSYQSIHILPINAFESLSEAEQQGYAIHQVFTDGGIIRPGFMIDKYMCSNNRGIASSIANADPIRCRSAAADMPDQLSKLNGAPPDKLFGIFYAAKTRGDNFEPSARFMRAALNQLTMAHSQIYYGVEGVNQYIHSPMANRWFDGAPTGLQWGNQGYFKDIDYPYPSAIKVLHNLALGSDGTAKTGSGEPLSLTSHNGQDCGVVDLANNLRAFEPGLHCDCITIKPDDYIWEEPVLDGVRRITGVVIPNHGLLKDDLIQVDFIDIAEWSRSILYRVSVIDADTIGVGYIYGAEIHQDDWDDFLSKNNTVTMSKFSAIRNLARYGDTVRSNPDNYQNQINKIRSDLQPIVMTWDENLSHPHTGSFYYSKASEDSLFSSDAQGNDWVLTGLGVPQRGMLSFKGGNAPYGGSQYHQAIREDMAVLSCTSGSKFNFETELWTINFTHSMHEALDDVGFRLASYPLSNHEGVIRNIDEEWGL